MGLSTISRAKRDQTWREDVVTNGIGRVEGITVDWIAGKANTPCIHVHMHTDSYAHMYYTYIPTDTVHTLTHSVSITDSRVTRFTEER